MGWLRRIIRFFLVIIAVAFFFGLGIILLMTYSPSMAANGANSLRGILGPVPVSTLEGMIFSAQDGSKQLFYHLGLIKPEAPWQPSAMANPQVITSQLPGDNRPKGQNKTPIQEGEKGLLKLTIPSTDQANAWTLPSIPSMGSLPGEGIWSPYLTDSSRQVIGLRTFLAPDPQRPYAILSIVAFNLKHSQLHFVLGSIEPHTTSYRLTGEIPAQDLNSGQLIAAFNGGFLAIHGEYGAMANGITPISPRNNLATIGIFKDGHILIGKWGQDLSARDDLVAWRQNGPMIIYQGQVTPAVSSNTTAMWGGTIEGHVVTWRSGIATNQDNTILYYFAGPSMDVGSMSKALVQLGVYQAMQLDINNFWVHFTSIQDENGQLTALPLVKAMSDKIDRYLKPYARDFFYVTSR